MTYPGRAATVLLAALLLNATPSALAQESPATAFDTFWLGPGLGAGSNDFAAHFNVSYQTGANLLSLRAATTAGIFSDGYGDVALLYGRATRPNRYHASVALGVAVADGCKGSGLGGCRARPSVFGFPIETTLGIQLGRLR